MRIIQSKIIPLPLRDVDTDMIIPAQYLTKTGREGLGKHVFAGLREGNAEFPFNQKKYTGAKILVARENFGCGSSREHAVWALSDWGIRAIIAPKFADIFSSNAMKNGIVPVELPNTFVDHIFHEEKKQKDFSITIDLGKQVARLSTGGTQHFDIDPYRKECLMKGISDFDYLLNHMSEMEKFEKNHDKNVFFDISQA